MNKLIVYFVCILGVSLAQRCDEIQELKGGARRKGPIALVQRLLVMPIRGPLLAARKLFKLTEGSKQEITPNGLLREGEYAWARLPPGGFTQLVIIEEVHSDGVVTVKVIGPDNQETSGVQILDSDIVAGGPEVIPISLVVKREKEKLQKMVKSGKCQLDAKDPEGRTALYHAARNGYKDMMETCKELGADINVRSKANTSLLYIASQNGHSHIVDYLLSLGVDPHSCTDKGACALHIAAQYGFDNIVRSLLKYGADPNASLKPGLSTPLYCASLFGHTSTMRILLEHGADVDKGSLLYDASPLCVVVGRGANSEVIDLLLSFKANVSATTKFGKSCLMAASISGHFSAVKKLIQAGAEIDHKDNHGNTALLMACVQGNTQIVKYILDQGGNPNEQQYAGVHPLLIACQNGFLEIAIALVEVGANVNLASYDGLFPLTVAAHLGHKDIVSLLISAGALANAKPHPHVGSPLQAAMKSNQGEIAEMLRNAGAKMPS
mmetsp:Transcript_22045/g.32856  ORF Transcript_22045/g.32856 Transcript_22045/m.32856 type:complete len:495 (+) Transcript_22045:49-1533(+)